MNNKLVRLIIAGMEQSFKSKMMIILNLILLLGTIAMVNYGTVVDIFESNNTEEEVTDEIVMNILLTDETGKLEEKLSEIASIQVSTEKVEDMENLEIFLTYDEESYLKLKMVSDEKIEGSIYDEIVSEVNTLKNELFRDNKNLTDEEIAILLGEVPVERVLNKLDNTLYDQYGYIVNIIGFGIYFLFIFIASTLASTVGLEKISRTTEYMLTGISSTAYLWFNIIQTIGVIIIQALLTFIYYLIANMINVILIGSVVDLGSIDMSIVTSLVSFDPTVVMVILYAIVQLIIAILILAILQAIITSKATNMTDIGNSTMIVILIAMFCAFIIPNFISDGEVVNIFMQIVSILPVVSCILVPKLMLLGQISTFMIILSIVISILTIVLLSIFGAKLFKRGLLNIQKITKKEIKGKKELSLEDRKFKNTIFNVGIAMLTTVVLANAVGILIPIIFMLVGYSGGNSTIWSTIITYTTYMLVPYLYLKLYFPRVNKDTNKEAKKSGAIKYILIAQPVIFALQYMVSFIAEKLNITFSGISNDMIGVTGGVLNSILVFTAVAILPAILEELLFRKGIMTLTKRYGVWFSIILSSAIFGIIHGNVIQSIFAFFMGMVIGFVYTKTKKLWPCIIIHLLNNGLAAIALINPSLEGTVTIITIVMAVIGLLMFIIRIKNVKKDYKIESDKEAVVKVNYMNIFTNISFIFFILFYIIMTIYTYILF